MVLFRNNARGFDAKYGRGSEMAAAPSASLNRQCFGCQLGPVTRIYKAEGISTAPGLPHSLTTLRINLWFEFNIADDQDASM